MLHRQRHFTENRVDSHRFLVENARRKGRTKHGGEFQREELADIPIVASDIHEDLLALNTALDKLKEVNPQAIERYSSDTLQGSRWQKRQKFSTFQLGLQVVYGPTQGLGCIKKSQVKVRIQKIFEILGLLSLDSSH